MEICVEYPAIRLCSLSPVSQIFAKIRYRLYVVFDKVHHCELEAKEKTGNGSSFVHHFDEKPSKTGEKRRKSVRIL